MAVLVWVALGDSRRRSSVVDLERIIWKVQWPRSIKRYTDFSRSPLLSFFLSFFYPFSILFLSLFSLFSKKKRKEKKRILFSFLSSFLHFFSFRLIMFCLLFFSCSSFIDSLSWYSFDESEFTGSSTSTLVHMTEVNNTIQLINSISSGDIQPDLWTKLDLFFSFELISMLTLISFFFLFFWLGLISRT